MKTNPDILKARYKRKNESEAQREAYARYISTKHRLTVTMSDNQLKTLKREAKKHGLSMNAYVLLKVFGYSEII